MADGILDCWQRMQKVEDRIYVVGENEFENIIAQLLVRRVAGGPRVRHVL
jgi:hypothetical protein